MLITHISTCLHALQAYITPSINHILKDNLVSFTSCGINNAHNNSHNSLKRSGNTQNCENQILITSIWLNSRLKDLFIESKNAQIRVRTRKLWSTEFEAADSHRCAKIVQTPKPNTTPTPNTLPTHTTNSPSSVSGPIIHGYG